MVHVGDDELTWEVGRVVAVDVNDGDKAVDVRPGGAGEVVTEIEAQKLVLRGVEPETRRGGKQIATTSCHRSLQVCNQMFLFDRIRSC
jgi:hypothetical protein